jgi:hypothetical protein
MEKVHLTLGLAACLTAFATGCASSGKVGEVQDVGGGTYSIGVSRSMGGMSQNADALKKAVDKAGEYCHSKGQKLQVSSAPSNNITFRCNL